MDIINNKIIVSVNVDRREAAILAVGQLIHTLKPLVVLIQDLPNKCRGNRLLDVLARKTDLKFHLIESSNHHESRPYQCGLENAILTHQVVKANKIILPSKSVTANTIVVGAEIQMPGKQKFHLYNIYIKPRATYNETQSLIDMIKTSTQALKSRSIIMGDFNAISPEWAKMDDILNCSHYNHLSQKHYKQIYVNRGRLISNAMKEIKLTCLNKIEEGPSFMSRQHNNTGSYIDLAMVGSKAKRIWNQFTIRKLDIQHEHRAIIIHPISLNIISPQDITQINYIYPTKRIKARHFEALKIETNSLCSRWERLDRKTMIKRMNQIAEFTYEHLSQIQKGIRIARANRTGIQQTNHHLHTKKLQLLSKKLKRYQTETRKFNRHHRLLISMKHRQSLKKLTKTKKSFRMIPILQNRIKNLIKRSIQTQEIRRKLKSNSNTQTESLTNMWDIINLTNRYIEDRSVSELELKANDRITNQEQLEQFVTEKFPTKLDQTTDSFKELISTPENEINWPTVISEGEIIYAMKKQRHKTYAGTDGIQFKIFNHAYKFIPNIIHTICKMSFLTATTPCNCQTTRGLMIPKKEAGKFRIVHISTPLASLLEQIALHRLEYRLETNKLKSDYQFGFKAHRGRHELITRIIELNLKHRAASSNEYSLGSTTTLISFDIEGAFDNVDQELLVEKILGEFGSDSLKYWLANFILNRYISVEHNTMQSRRTRVCTGVPQGSSLGPILWNYMINNIESDITESTRLELLAYADDLYLIHNGHNTQLIQDKINLLTHKLTQMKLWINPRKCCSMVLGKGMNNLNNYVYTIYGDPIEQVNKMKILGVTINQNLRLDQNEQLEAVMENTNKLYQINRLGIIKISTNWHVLINSYLTSIVITNNMPILAIDKKARIWADKLMTRCLKIIFRWPNNISDKLTRLITKTYTCRLNIESNIRKKMHTEHRHGYELLGKVLENRDKIEYGNISDLSKPEYYCGRKHFNPNMMLEPPKFIQINYHNLKPVWIISEREGGSLFVEILNNQILQIRGAYHRQYPTKYFNTMAVIWDTTKDNSVTNRNILIEESNPLKMAIYNYDSNDWRVIKLREQMVQQNWKMFTTDTKTFRIHKGIANSTMLTNVRITDEPWIRDYRGLNQDRSAINSQRNKEMEMNQTRITAYLGGKHENWQSIDPSEFTSKHMIALTGLLCNNQGILIKDTVDAYTTPHACQENTCITQLGSITLHRMMECQRYEALRATTFETEPTKERMREWFKNATMRRKILKLMTSTTM